MNCANHAELPVSAYCQNCGKPLCTQCVRSVAGVVYCEPCLASRLHPGAASGAAPGSAAWGRVADPLSAVPPGVRVSGAPSPVLAGFLGAIPGVGAMYNGQFVKAFAHVIIFVILISISNRFDAVGVLVAAWFFYQIFDAVQTAIARRDGKPLPDPLGLNDLGQRLGVPAAAGYAPPPVPPTAGAPSWAPATGSAPQGSEPSPASGFSSATAAAGGPGAADPSAMPPLGANWEEWAQRAATAKALHDMGAPVTGAGYDPPPFSAVSPAVPLAYAGRPEPIGAIVLIAVGMLFLLSTLGVFEWRWIGHGWPILIIALGAWLLFRRARTAPPAGGGL